MQKLQSGMNTKNGKPAKSKRRGINNDDHSDGDESDDDHDDEC